MPWRPDENDDRRDWGEDDAPRDWEDEAADEPLEMDVDEADEAETATVPCPACGRAVAEIADRCPHCGEHIVPGRERRRRGGWFLLVVLLAMAVVLLWLIR